MSAGERDPGLDGLRGLAILLVMPFHLTRGFHWSEAGLDRFLAAWGTTGYLGVDLFFVLSGFLITGILLDTRDEPGYLGRFYLRRCLRILPLYYGMVVVLVLAGPVLAPGSDIVALTREHQGWFWGHAVNWLIGLHGSFSIVARPVDVTWSLAIEEQFYLLWPLLVWLLRPRGLLVLSAGMLLASLAARYALASHGATLATIYVLTPARLDGLAVGAAIAVLLRTRPDGLARLWRAWPLVLLAFTLAILLTVQRWPIVPLFTVAALGWGGVLLATLRPGGRWSALVRRPWLRRMGLYSYGMYLLHPWVEHWLPRLGLDAAWFEQAIASDALAHLAYLAIAVTTTTALAALSFHLYELPFLRLKDRLVPRAADRLALRTERIALADEGVR